MNPVLARRLDRLLVPALRACAPQGPGTETPPNGPVAAIKLIGIGSLWLAMPVLDAFAKQTGRQVFLVTVAANRPFLDLLQGGPEPIFLNSSSPVALALSCRRAIRQLRRIGVGTVIDLEFYSAFTTLLGHAIRAKRHVALAAPWRDRCLSEAVSWPPDLHFRDLVGSILSREAGETLAPSPRPALRPDALPPPLPVPGNAPRVVVNPNAGPVCRERRLPPAAFAAVMEHLARTRNVFFEVIGSRDETHLAAEVLSCLPPEIPCRNLAGRLTPAELVSCLADASLVITNDSGPMHLAAAAGTPVLAFFGPETPDRFRPLGNGHTLVVGTPDCHPCLTADNLKRAPCRGNNICLTTLPVDALARIAGEALDSPPGGQRTVVFRDGILLADSAT